MSEEEEDGPEWGALIGMCDTPLVSHADDEVRFSFLASERINKTIVMRQSLEARNLPGVKIVSSDGSAAVEPDASAAETVSESTVTTGAVVWDGAVIAARFLEKNRDFFSAWCARNAAAAACRATEAATTSAEGHLRRENQPLAMLELGAGCCGLVGLVAAALGYRAVVTDSPPAVLAALAATVAANPLTAAPAGSFCGSIAVKDLDWTKWPHWFVNGDGEEGDEDGNANGGSDAGADAAKGGVDAGAARVSSKFDLVVCADCVYDVQLVLPLLQTARATLVAGGLVLATVDTAVHRPEALKMFASTAADLFESVELVEPNSPPLRQWESAGAEDSDTVKVFLLSSPK